MTATTASDQVEIIVPVRPRFGSTLRVLTSALAADCGFTIDEIDDIRLGLSEVFNVLSETVSADGDTADDSRVRVTFRTDTDQLTVKVHSVPGSAAPLEFDELATSILHSVLDAVTIDDEGVSMVKRANEANAPIDDAS